jgi:GntR family transcriptional regulator
MTIRLDRKRQEGLLDQARSQIVAALHAGLIRPGDQLPSMRRVAAVSGLNVKTVMRIYARLRDEKILVLRGGSGAFLADHAPAGLEPAESLRLVRLVRRHLDEASGAGLAQDVYAALVGRVVTRSALRGRSVAVLECNTEQVRLYAQEIGARIGVTAHPVLLSALAEGTVPEAVRSATLLAATDFHLKEGGRIARRLGKPLVRLRMRDDFVPSLIDAARRGRLVMVVHDASFSPAFKRALGVLGLAREGLDRITVVPGNRQPAVRRALAAADTVYVSPLCPRGLGRLAPRGARHLTFANHLADESIEELEAFLLFSGEAV